MPIVYEIKKQERKMPIKKMVTYELLEELKKLPFYDQLLSAKIIPRIHIDHKEIYEFYKSQKDATGVMAKTNTAEEFNISERSVYLIVKKMRGC